MILCEALLDALTFCCAGYRNVTSSYGIEGFTDEILATFRRHGVKRVLIAYDADEAGNRAAEKLAPRLMAEGFECWFPKGSDASQYALEVKPAAKSLGLVIRQAEWLGNGAAPMRSEVKVVPVLPPQAASVNEAAADSPLRRGSAQVLAAELSVSSAAAPSTVEATPTDPEPPAYRVPPSEPALPIAIDDKELRLVLGDRAYTVRGIEKNLSYEQLKVWLRVSVGDPSTGSGQVHVHVDTLELYAAKQRAVWLKQAAIELGVSEDILRGDRQAAAGCGATPGCVDQGQAEPGGIVIGAGAECGAGEQRADAAARSDIGGTNCAGCRGNGRGGRGCQCPGRVSGLRLAQAG